MILNSTYAKHYFVIRKYISIKSNFLLMWFQSNIRNVCNTIQHVTSTYIVSCIMLTSREITFRRALCGKEDH